MPIRHAAPVSFLVILIATIASAILLSVFPGSQLLWFANQEMYARLRELMYLLATPPFSLPIALALCVAVLVALIGFRKNNAICFLANHASLAAVVLLALTNWRRSPQASLTALYQPGDLLWLAGRIDEVLVTYGLMIAASCVACHWRYWHAYRAQGNRASGLVPG